MTLSWNEIRQRAQDFVTEWLPQAQTVIEKSKDQSFMAGFLDIFNKQLKRKAEMQYPVNFGKDETTLFGTEPGKGRKGWIDCFVPRLIAIEMKSPGVDLDKAFEQIRHYNDALPSELLPNGLLVCDFNTFIYYDYTAELRIDPVVTRFTLEELPQKVELFYYLAGFKKAPVTDISPVDIEAAERMGELYSAMVDSGYEGHQLEMYLVRLLFCLFAEDSGIFERKNMFFEYIGNYTKKDGSDLALHLAQIFETLNKEEEKRLKMLDEKLNEFPYIDGGLFEERLETAAFNKNMRDTLLKCCALDWSKIKPEIFGAMFQSVKSKEARRELGEHYTSEKNIMKIVRPLFLDKLRDEFEKIKSVKSAGRKQKLLEFHTKLREIRFLDPACGCGNFLVVSYRELRKLEIEVLSEYLDGTVLDIDLYIRVNVDQFYGIEIEEFPARIAQTALWLMDHLMNMEASKKFGKYITRIPLTASPNIKIANALRMDWGSLVPKNKLTYILGNPPFVGASKMNARQKEETVKVFSGLKGCNSLDYVTCWYKTAAEYIKDTNIEVAFVSTNSICQGEQVPILWPQLLQTCGVRINFAHETFKWANEASGKAAVCCVIIGFALFDRNEKHIYRYAEITGDPVQHEAQRINVYLEDAAEIIVAKRSEPLCKQAPKMVYGSKPADGGHLILTQDERDELLQKEPGSKRFIREFVGGKEFITGRKRYCLWLADIGPEELKKLPLVYKRVKAVKDFRLASTAKATVEAADRPTRFFTIAQPNAKYLVVPEVTTAGRVYIPIAYMDKKIIVSNKCLIVAGAGLYEFGVLNSLMHIAWARVVSGRLGNEFQYSASMVYNTFSWPDPTGNQRKAIEDAAQAVLDARKLYKHSSLFALYDAVAMPAELKKAHHNLDKAVEAAYGKSFANDADRVAHLFYLYETLNNTLHAPLVKKVRKSNK